MKKHGKEHNELRDKLELFTQICTYSSVSISKQILESIGNQLSFSVAPTYFTHIKKPYINYCLATPL